MGQNDFGSASKNFKPEGYLKNPYTPGKQVYDSRVGDLVVRQHNWQKIAFCAMAVAFLAVGGLWYQSSKAMVVPVIITVTEDGIPTSLGTPEKRNHPPNEKEIKYFLNQFVQKSRSVPLDPVLYRENLSIAYQLLYSDASHKMDTLMQQENQTAKSGKVSVQTTVKVIVPLSDSTWQVRWTEEVYEKGILRENYRMTGLFTLAAGKAKDEQEILINPLGIYIKDLSWSKEL